MNNSALLWVIVGGAVVYFLSRVSSVPGVLPPAGWSPPPTSCPPGQTLISGIAGNFCQAAVPVVRSVLIGAGCNPRAGLCPQ